MITDGDFSPQFGEAEVFELVTTHDSVDRDGFVARVPTENKADDDISVRIGAYAPSVDTGGLEVRVTASKNGRDLAALYVDAETIESEPNGYRSYAPSEKDGGELSPQGILPGWDDIRDAAQSVIDSGQEIIDGAAETFTETADFLEDELNDTVDEAYEQTEPLFDAVEFTPTPDKEPPQDLVDSANELGATYVETIDLDRACYTIGLTLTLGNAVSVTMTGVGAGGGTLVALGGGIAATIGGCTLLDFINTFKADSSCSFRYAYVFEEKDITGDTENWLIAMPCE
ncbi:hypothetical protein [Halorubrum sp. AS12]|uniref:hypothetical protein n=1 Tax=Halorubrum sp. AS12 TaxID=3409687 RepID=UPI003DA6EBA5